MPKITLDSQVKQNATIYTSCIDDEVVMLNIDLGKYFGMNTIASDIWKKIKDPLLVKTLTESLSSEYNVTPMECQSDVMSFLEKLAENGLIEICECEDANV